MLTHVLFLCDKHVCPFHMLNMCKTFVLHMCTFSCIFAHFFFTFRREGYALFDHYLISVKFGCHYACCSSDKVFEIRSDVFLMLLSPGEKYRP